MPTRRRGAADSSPSTRHGRGSARAATDDSQETTAAEPPVTATEQLLRAADEAFESVPVDQRGSGAGGPVSGPGDDIAWPGRAPLPSRDSQMIEVRGFCLAYWCIAKSLHRF